MGDNKPSYEELRLRVKELEQETHLRRQAEEALLKNEEKYRLLVENANDAIFIAQDEVLKFCNHQTEKLIGYSREELAETPFVNFIHSDDRIMVFERHKKRLSGENPPSTYSFRIINRDGKDLWVQLSTVVITWDGRPATLNFLRNITEQKRLEAQLQQAQKMEALGTLAGGIAHDFNNLLMAIQGNTSLMLYNMNSSHPHYRTLKNIENSIENGAKLTKQLLGYARKGKYQVKALNLNRLVKETTGTLGRTRKQITIQCELSSDLSTVLADQGQLEQMLLNLYVNAADAMPQGGKLILKTTNTTHEDINSKLYVPKPGNYALLKVTDTGIGMDKQIQQRIFDPFFTTKEMGRGTGLGLASVYGIVKNHNGYIEVESEKGRGTSFSIYLPASDRIILKIDQSANRIIKGSGTILIVDDEEMVLDVSGEVLKTLGYRVLEAIDGRAAIELYRENKDNIDLVILDIIMPEMDGGKVYDKIKEINPNVKVLLSSGYSINGEATEILKRGCNAFIQKPFSLNELSEKIGEILTKN